MRQYSKIALQSVRVVAAADKGVDKMTSVTIDEHILTFFTSEDSEPESPELEPLTGDCHNGFYHFKVIPPFTLAIISDIHSVPDHTEFVIVVTGPPAASILNIVSPNVALDNAICMSSVE